MAKVLYLSLTGMAEPLGRSQVLEYLMDLSKEHTIYLLSFERRKDFSKLEDVRRFTRQHGIVWHHLTYSNRFGVFSTLLQISGALRLASRCIRKHRISIVHARSMIPATIGLFLKKMHGVKLLFDIRGFAADEKVDSGRVRKPSFLYAMLKKLDNRLYCSSDHIVTLTLSAKKILADNLGIDSEKITVIPTCANRTLFKPLGDSEKMAFRRSLGYEDDAKIIIHSGTVGTWYDFDSEVKLVKALMERDSAVRLLVLNKNEQPFIRLTVEKYGLPPERVVIDSCSFEAMHRYLNIADVSLFFIRPTFSKQASAPTKFAENVACHLPSVTNRGVGDMEYYLTHFPVGYLVDIAHLDETIGDTAKSLLRAMEEGRKDLAAFDRLFDTHFDKRIAVKKYAHIYESIQRRPS